MTKSKKFKINLIYMEIIFTPDPELVEEIELKDLEKRLESQ